MWRTPSSGFTYVLISDLRRDQDSPTQGSSCHRIIVVHQDFRVVGPERRPDLFISRLRLYRRCLLTIVVDRTHVRIVVRALQVRNQGRGRGRGRATSTSSRNVSGSRESLSLLLLCDRFVAIMIITWSTRERGTNDGEITREWMCPLRFNESGGGNCL